MNSRLLVAFQFLLVGAILIPKPHATTFCSFWWLFLILSGGMTWWTFRHNRFGNFNIVPEIKPKAQLVTTGPYRYVRHPMYSALLLAAAGVVCYRSHWFNWLLFVLLALVLYLKASKEERLWCAHHEAYDCYRRGTKYFIPFLL